MHISYQGSLARFAQDCPPFHTLAYDTWASSLWHAVCICIFHIYVVGRTAGRMDRTEKLNRKFTIHKAPMALALCA